MAEEQNIDDYITSEERKVQKQLSDLTDQAHEGAMFADWKNAYCTRKLLEWLDEQISDSKNMWLAQPNRDTAEAIRLQSQAYTKIKNWVMAKIKTGEVAAVGVKQFHEEGIELEGLVKLPPPAK